MQVYLLNVILAFLDTNQSICTIVWYTHLMYSLFVLTFEPSQTDLVKVRNVCLDRNFSNVLGALSSQHMGKDRNLELESKD